MTIELTRKHAVLFTLLLAIQTAGFWISITRSPTLSALPKSVWGLMLFPMVPGSAFLTTVAFMELMRAFHKN